MKNIQIHELRDINDYSKSRCKKIIQEYSLININYYRGQYKGYIYIIKLVNTIISKNYRMKHYELYNIIKNQKNLVLRKYHPKNDYKNGVIDALYDILNYTSSQNCNSPKRIE